MCVPVNTFFVMGKPTDVIGDETQFKDHSRFVGI